MPTSPLESGHAQRLAFGSELRRQSDVWTEKGLTLAALGQDGKALDAFDHALALYRRSPRTWYNKGLLLAKLHRYSEALVAFEAALERNAEASFLWLQKGLVLTALGRDADAVDALDHAVRLDPRDALAWRYRGAALFRLGRYEEALAAYDQTLQLDSDRTVVWRARGPAEKIEVPAEAANLGVEPFWSLTVGHTPSPSDTRPASVAPPRPPAPAPHSAPHPVHMPSVPPQPTSPSPLPRASSSSSLRMRRQRGNGLPSAAGRTPIPRAIPAPPVLPQPMQAPTSQPTVAPAPAVALDEHPRLAANVALHGEMKDAGFQQVQWLAERDGRFLQLTELVYHVAACCDGAHTLEAIAEQVRVATGKNVSAENVRYLLVTRLVPAGLIVGSGPAADPAMGLGRRNAATPPARPRSLLSVNLRFAPFSPRIVNAVAGICQYVFFPPVLAALLFLSLAGQVWLYVVVRFNFQSALGQAFAHPATLLAVVALIAVSSLCHEVGHASALRYGGGRARRIGLGFYLLMPVFYADVSENYRLGRWSRIRTDLGGICFNLIVDVPLFGAYLLTHQPVFLFVVAAINIEILYNLLPFGRFDGYWVLADLTGIPDFFALMGPFLRSLSAFRWWRGPALPALKPWVRMVYLVYTLCVVPALGLLFLSMLISLPLTLPALVRNLGMVPSAVLRAWGQHDVFGALAAAGQGVILLLFLVAVVYGLISLARTVGGLVARLLARKRTRPAHPSAA